MGLFSVINPGFYGYLPLLPWNIIPNYEIGNEILINDFLAISKSRAPIRTGYLVSSLEGHQINGNVFLYTLCDYAQYVEYGTWKQTPQPYFKDAVNSGLNSAKSSWHNEYFNGLRKGYQIGQKYAEEFRMYFYEYGEFLLQYYFNLAELIYNMLCAMAEYLFAVMLACGTPYLIALQAYKEMIEYAETERQFYKDVGREYRETYRHCGKIMFREINNLTNDIYDQYSRIPQPVLAYDPMII